MREDYEFQKQTSRHPDKHEWVKLVERIRHNLTGEIREYFTTGIFKEESQSVFIWPYEEGNATCDCNLSEHWKFAGDIEKELFAGTPMPPCGHALYAVNLYSTKGKLLHEGFKEEALSAKHFEKGA